MDEELEFHLMVAGFQAEQILPLLAEAWSQGYEEALSRAHNDPPSKNPYILR